MEGKDATMSIPPQLQRVVIIGLPGSGKTTLARQLAERLGRVPHVELDALHWEPNWTTAPRDVFRGRVDAALLESGSWVADGNYKVVRDIVWIRADTVIWLDYSLNRTLWRLVRRTGKRVLFRKRLWNGNRESASLAISRDPQKSVVAFAIDKHKTLQAEMQPLFLEPQYQHLSVLHFHAPKETEAWYQKVVAVKAVNGQA